MYVYWKLKLLEVLHLRTMLEPSWDDFDHLIDDGDCFFLDMRCGHIESL